MFVNASGEQAEVLHANVEFSDDDEYEIAAAAEHIMRIADRAEQREQNKGRLDKLVTAIKSAFGGAQSESSQTTTANAKAPEGDMSLTKEEVQALLAPLGEQLTAVNTKLESLETAQKEQGETVTALKANADAAAAAESAKVDEQLKAAGFDDEDLKGMTANAKAKVLAKQAPPVHGFNVNAHFAGNADKGPQDTLPE